MHQLAQESVEAEKALAYLFRHCWSRSGAEAMLALRCALLSDRWLTTPAAVSPLNPATFLDAPHPALAVDNFVDAPVSDLNGICQFSP